MKPQKIFVFVVFSILVLLPFVNSSEVFATVVGTCYKDGCGPNQTAKYEYTVVQCIETNCFPGPCEYNAQAGPYREFETASIQFQNTPFGWQCDPAPANCGDYNGFSVDPNCGIGGPGDPSCPGGQPRAGSCGIGCQCGNWANECCNFVPPGCKAQLGCPVLSTPTPTPTPPPSCDLICPGGTVPGDFNGGSDINVAGATTLVAQLNDIGSGSGSNSINNYHSCGLFTDNPNLKNDPETTFGEGIVEGDLTFFGYNGFICDGLLSCPLDPQNPETCPSPTIVTGGSTDTTSGGGNSVKGAFSNVLGATSDSPRFNDSPLGQVLGAATTLLAQSIDNGGSTTTVGQTTTWIKNVSAKRLTGSEATAYGWTALDNRGYACSCQTVVACQQSLQLSPNSVEQELETCNNECNFSFTGDSEYPEATQSITINIEANEGFEDSVILDWDNGTVEDVTGLTERSALLGNAGVYDVKLTCSNPGNNVKTCTRRYNVYCEGSNPPTLPTPTPTPPGAWAKYQDSSYHTKNSIANPAPVGALAFDEFDKASCDRNNPTSRACVISGQAGVATVKGTGSFGVRLSDRQWLRNDSGYTMNTLLTPSSFIEYARARKEIFNANSLTPNDLTPEGINYYPASATISNNNIPDSLAAGQPILIIIDGNLTIDTTQGQNSVFNPDNKPIAFIVDGQINFTKDMTEANGIFIGNTVDFVSDTAAVVTTPFKLNGNISTTNFISQQCNAARQRDDNELQPSCMFTFDFANQFLPLTELLSTRSYEWTELVP